MAQLEIEEFLAQPVRKHSNYLDQLPWGAIFKKKTPTNRNANEIYMRVKPVNYLCNSNLINDQISKNNCMVINLRKGTCFIMNGDTEIVRMRGKLQIEKEKNNE